MHWEVSDEEIDWLAARTAVVAEDMVDVVDEEAIFGACCVDVFITVSSFLIDVTCFKIKVK